MKNIIKQKVDTNISKVASKSILKFIPSGKFKRLHNIPNTIQKYNEIDKNANKKASTINTQTNLFNGENLAYPTNYMCTYTKFFLVETGNYVSRDVQNI